jgi:hypothetical protein
MTVRRATALLPIALALALAGCPSNDCVDREKQFVLDATRYWYLYQDLLPATIDPASYPDAGALLDALTADARAQGKDRRWSHLADLAATRAYYAGAGTVGFGMSLQERGTQLFVTQVVAGSAADDAGFARGDEILGIGTSTSTLVTAEDLIASDGLAAALGPASSRVTRVFDVVPVTGGEALRTVAKRPYAIDPVPAYGIIGTTGYVNLRTFTETAPARLDAAFASFAAAGTVTDVIVDLRYNGGGLVDVAEHLANLLGGARFPGQTMHTWRVNPARSSDPDLPAAVTFSAPANPVAPARIAFITTEASASASELVANVLEPWAEVAIVGARTYGKPVGQFQLPLEECNLSLALVAFQLPNADGDTDFYQGLPDQADPPAFSGPLCPAEDDLAHPMGDALEASTAAAIAWISDGICPAPPAAPAPLVSRALVSSLRVRYPAPAAPTPAQRENPGLF